MQTPQHTVNWLLATLLALILAGAHLLDGPSELQAAQDVAADLADALALAQVHQVQP